MVVVILVKIVIRDHIDHSPSPVNPIPYDLTSSFINCTDSTDQHKSSNTPLSLIKRPMRAINRACPSAWVQLHHVLMVLERSSHIDISLVFGILVALYSHSQNGFAETRQNDIPEHYILSQRYVEAGY